MTPNQTGLCGLVHGSRSESFKRLNAHLVGGPALSAGMGREVAGIKQEGTVRAKPNKGRPERALIASGLPVPEYEFRFHPARRWRFDYAWPAQKVALEVEGGVWTNGRHTRGKGFINDVYKYNAAVELGWRVIRCVPDELLSAGTIGLLKTLLK